MGFNDSYSAIQSQIFLLDSLPIISKAYSFIPQEEQEWIVRIQLSCSWRFVDIV